MESFLKASDKTVIASSTRLFLIWIRPMSLPSRVFLGSKGVPFVSVNASCKTVNALFHSLSPARAVSSLDLERIQFTEDF